MSRYKWVHHGSDRLCDVGILPDGSLHNPNGYPEDLVRTAILAADARRHERRSQAAKKAGETRRRRQERRTAEVAKRLLTGQGLFGERKNCWICGRGLGDPESIKRGIGSDCWQDALSIAERYRIKAATP